MPHRAAGMRVDPPVSVPRPAGAMRAAIAAAVPPDEPPGMRVWSYGFFTAPANDARLVLVMPKASSCRLVLPSTMAPASISFCRLGAFAAGRTLRKAAVPPVVGSSRVLMLSLTTIGSPASGGSAAPLRRAASTARAAASALASFNTISAFKSDNALARASSVFM